MEDLLERDIPWSAKATFFTGLKAKEAGWKQQATGAALGGIAGAGAGFLRYRADKSGTSVAERSAMKDLMGTRMAMKPGDNTSKGLDGMKMRWNKAKVDSMGKAKAQPLKASALWGLVGATTGLTIARKLTKTGSSMEGLEKVASGEKVSAAEYAGACMLVGLNHQEVTKVAHANDLDRAFLLQNIVEADLEDLEKTGGVLSGVAKQFGKLKNVFKKAPVKPVNLGATKGVGMAPGARQARIAKLKARGVGKLDPTGQPQMKTPTPWSKTNVGQQKTFRRQASQSGITPAPKNQYEFNADMQRRRDSAVSKGFAPKSIQSAPGDVAADRIQRGLNKSKARQAATKQRAAQQGAAGSPTPPPNASASTIPSGATPPVTAPVPAGAVPPVVPPNGAAAQGAAAVMPPAGNIERVGSHGFRLKPAGGPPRTPAANMTEAQLNQQLANMKPAGGPRPAGTPAAAAPPAGAVPAGAPPAGVAPGAPPVAAVPPGAAAVPPAAVPSGAVPPAAVPPGAMPLGAAPMPAGMPAYGPAQMGQVGGPGMMPGQVMTADGARVLAGGMPQYLGAQAQQMGWNPAWNPYALGAGGLLAGAALT